MGDYALFLGKLDSTCLIFPNVCFISKECIDLDMNFAHDSIVCIECVCVLISAFVPFPMFNNNYRSTL